MTSATLDDCYSTEQTKNASIRQRRRLRSRRGSRHGGGAQLVGDAAMVGLCMFLIGCTSTNAEDRYTMPISLRSIRTPTYVEHSEYDSRRIHPWNYLGKHGSQKITVPDDPFSDLREDMVKGRIVQHHGETLQTQRRLPLKKGGGSGGSGGYGCLDYDTSELSNYWTFKSAMPDCSYVSYNDDDTDDDDHDDDQDDDDHDDDQDDDNDDDVVDDDNDADDGGEGGGGGDDDGNGDDDADDDGGGGGGGGDDNADDGGGGGGGDDGNGDDGNGGDDRNGADDDNNNGDDNQANAYDDGNDDRGGNADNGGNNYYNNQDVFDDDDGDVVDYNVLYGDDDDDEREYQDPYEAFDLSKCSTYGNLWLWDLAMSCEADTLENCECNFAETLVGMGKLSCEGAVCPENCPVCGTCLKVIGCGEVGTFSVENRVRHDIWVYLFAATVGILIFSLALYAESKRRRNRAQLAASMNEALMEPFPPSEIVVPPNHEAPPAPVWLAPVT